MLTNTSHLYYRVENGNVYSLGLDNTEYIRFNLNLNEGDTCYYNESKTYDVQWRASLCDQADIMLINENPVTGCYRFCFDIKEMIDDEHSVWLAPYIGIVRMTCGECNLPVTDLLWAEIDGEMKFNNQNSSNKINLIILLPVHSRRVHSHGWLHKCGWEPEDNLSQKFPCPS